MEEETPCSTENVNVGKEIRNAEVTHNIDSHAECSPTLMNSEEEQISHPNNLDSTDTTNCHGSNKNSANMWRSRQSVEEVTASVSSSDEETPSTPEKTVRRRKVRPKNNTPVASNKQKKMQQIQDVLSSSPLDLEVLRELAISDGGLVTDELRRKAWPSLMMIEHMEVSPKPVLEVVQGHKDYNQVVLDVKRTLKRFPPGIDDDYRLILMDQLTVLIIRVLMKHPELHYYQGYHDVAITFLLVMGEDMGFEMVEKLSLTHLIDFMRPTMEKTHYYLTYLYPILYRANHKLYQCLTQSGVGTVFCLPWLITWFAHTLSDYRNVVRLYDFFLASPYLMPMYIATAIVLQKEKDLLAEEWEITAQFCILSKDTDSLPFEDILIEARELHDKYPPDTLQEEVDEFLEKKKQQEQLDHQLIMERRKKFDGSKSQNKKFVEKVLEYVYIPLVPERRQKLLKIALFTATVFLAQSLYKHYYTSAVGLPAVVE